MARLVNAMKAMTPAAKPPNRANAKLLRLALSKSSRGEHAHETCGSVGSYTIRTLSPGRSCAGLGLEPLTCPAPLKDRPAASNLYSIEPCSSGNDPVTVPSTAEPDDAKRTSIRCSLLARTFTNPKASTPPTTAASAVTAARLTSPIKELFARTSRTLSKLLTRRDFVSELGLAGSRRLELRIPLRPEFDAVLKALQFPLHDDQVGGFDFLASLGLLHGGERLVDRRHHGHLALD